MKFIACAAALLFATAAAGDAYDYKELVVREVGPAKVAANAAGRSVVDFGRRGDRPLKALANWHVLC